MSTVVDISVLGVKILLYDGTTYTDVNNNMTMTTGNVDRYCSLTLQEYYSVMLNNCHSSIKTGLLVYALILICSLY